jgi:hypothetical protein
MMYCLTLDEKACWTRAGRVLDACWTRAGSNAALILRQKKREWNLPIAAFKYSELKTSYRNSVGKGMRRDSEEVEEVYK